MSRTLRASVAVVTLACVLACGSGLTPVNPASFIRPERVAFTCVRTTKAGERVPVPLDQCSPCSGHPNEHSLYAFVTQTTRGELAAVDLKARRVIDTQTTVPGYTFVPVGEAPSALVVPTIDPKHTYVVSVGSSDLRVLDTQRLLGSTATTASTLATIPLGQLVGGVWHDAEPVDMVLAADADEQQDEQRLVIAAPRLHALLVINVADLDRVVAGEIDASEVPQTLVPLSGLTDVATVVSSSESDRYTVSCGVNEAQPSKAVGARGVAASMAAAMPMALALDAENHRVLVADAALPIIHEVALDTLTEVRDGGRPSFVTGVPTLDVVIGPKVPASTISRATVRYIYAIEAEQRRVLVLNDSGVMQSVNAAGTPERIDFGPSGALSIEVISPGYLAPGVAACAPEVTAVGPRMLRGVFLAASMIDGTIRIADVYDLHAGDRCSAGDDAACTEDEPCAAIQRHRPRIGGLFSSRQPCIRPVAGSGAALAVSLTAVAAKEPPGVPSLVELETCADPMVAAFERVTSEDEVTLECAASETTGTRKPLVCVNADPWTMTAEAWTAQWEGAVTGIGSGALSADGATFKSDSMDFCASGVLGGEIHQIELLVPVADTSTRDMYELGNTTDCSLFAKPQSDGTNARLTVPIIAATFETLTLGELADVPDGFKDLTRAEVLSNARYCSAGMRLSFRIRSKDRYTVVGERSGYLHRVIRGTDEAGTCAIDPAADLLREGQAIADEPFTNGRIEFMISALASDTNNQPTEPPRDMRFGFSVAAAPGPLYMVTGATTSAEVTSTIVPELRYSPTDARLYAVDSAARGLMPISLSPLPTGLASTSVFR